MPLRVGVPPDTGSKPSTRGGCGCTVAAGDAAGPHSMAASSSAFCTNHPVRAAGGVLWSGRSRRRSAMARVMARRWAVVLMLAPAQLRRGRPLPRDLRLRPSLQGGPGRGRADDGVWSVTVACSGEIWSRRRLVACGGCYWLVVAVGAARVCGDRVRDTGHVGVEQRLEEEAEQAAVAELRCGVGTTAQAATALQKHAGVVPGDAILNGTPGWAGRRSRAWSAVRWLSIGRGPPRRPGRHRCPVRCSFRRVR